MTHDVILTGGGLANGLIAWRLRQTHPQLRILIVERGATLGGNHTWSFHDGDLTPAQHGWLAPFIVHHWPTHTVKFPGQFRHLSTGYHSVTSERFHDLLSQSGINILLNAPIASLTPNSVTLADGTIYTAPLVVDGRGFAPNPHLWLGWQKFVGLELDCPNHGLREPILMDATVPQRDGYRFLYTLPLGPDRLLVEDTRYSDTLMLDEAELHAECLAYAATQGWIVTDEIRTERGALPITLGGDIDAFWATRRDGIPRSGLSAGLFHPVTGYSLPDAVRLADLVAAAPRFASAPIAVLVETHARRQWRRQRFLRLLNRMLFLAAAPSERWRVLARFYRLPPGLIGRFYAGRLRWTDTLRLLAGRPPVPLGAALKACFTRRP